MAKIPFKRVTEAFNEIARARLCESSGSEHSTGDSAELSDLINSFIQKDDDNDDSNGNGDGDGDGDPSYIDDQENLPDLKKKRTRGCDPNAFSLLRNLLECGSSEKSHVKALIRSELQLAIEERISNFSQDEGFRRQLMSQLRERGLDAGLCKSRWKKIGQFPAGDHEYIDINVNGTRYIVEIKLAEQFTIARPTSHYQSLLELFPPIYVGESDDLKQMVKIMSNAVKKCMKNSDIQVPPWRRNSYMLAKWFGSYKRTVNAFSERNGESFGDESGTRRWVGFETLKGGLHYCRGDQVGRRGVMRVGNLAQLLLSGSSNCN